MIQEIKRLLAEAMRCETADIGLQAMIPVRNGIVVIWRRDLLGGYEERMTFIHSSGQVRANMFAQ